MICDFEVTVATFSHEMKFDRENLRQDCDFEVTAATVSHEMRFDRQRLILDDGWPASAEKHVTLVLLQRDCKEYINNMV